SAFYGTDLDVLLRSLGTETVVIAGINTNTCVLCSAFDAFNRDLRVVVASDAVASMYGEDLHIFGLENLRRCLGWVLTTDEILAVLGAAKAPAPACQGRPAAHGSGGGEGAGPPILGRPVDARRPAPSRAAGGRGPGRRPRVRRGAHGPQLHERPAGAARDAAAGSRARDHRGRRRGRPRRDRGSRGRPGDDVLLPDLRAVRVLPGRPRCALPRPPREP